MAQTHQDLTLFDQRGWWDQRCRAFASLRRVSAFRIGLLRRWLGDDWRGQKVVDLGCGGGLLSLPLARLGARVVGVDLARQALHEAQQEARAHGDAFRPACGTLLQAPLADGCADVALLADVVEHVPEPERAVAEAARVLRVGGHLFVNTIDRTLRSRLLAIWLGEGLGLIPRRTHDWRLFVRPGELEAMAQRAGLVQREIVGEAPRLLTTVRRWTIELRESRSTAVGYAALFQKRPCSRSDPVPETGAVTGRHPNGPCDSLLCAPRPRPKA
ncbi:MAG: bifunctional 2-polyprenyl-6-hydroxyphenol methylase/3-demethylubiquinol 3-O-methyltransferase UbiG [Planctomycetota bacterium]